MRSKIDGRLLGRGLWSNLLFYLHINYAIVVLSFYSAWLLFAFQEKGWNVRGVKRLWGETNVGRGEMSWHPCGYFILITKNPCYLFIISLKKIALSSYIRKFSALTAEQLPQWIGKRYSLVPFKLSWIAFLEHLFSSSILYLYYFIHLVLYTSCSTSCFLC